MKSEVLVTQSLPALSDPMDIAHQGPLFMEFSRQKSWSGLPFHCPGDLPDPGIEPGSPASPAVSLPSEPPGESVNYMTYAYTHTHSFPGDSAVKNSPANARRHRSDAWVGENYYMY